MTVYVVMYEGIHGGDTTVDAIFMHENNAKKYRDEAAKMFNGDYWVEEFDTEDEVVDDRIAEWRSR